MSTNFNSNLTQSQFNSLLQWSAANKGSSSNSLNSSDLSNLYNNDTNLTVDEKKALASLSNGGQASQASSSQVLDIISNGTEALNWTELSNYQNKATQNLTQSIQQLSVSLGIVPDTSNLSMDANDPDQCDGVNVQFQA